MVSPEDYPEDQRAKLDEGDANRGHRPGKGSGPVTGSGAGAGGKGNTEDFDADPQGGGGQAPIPADRGPKEGAYAPLGGSRSDTERNGSLSTTHDQPSRGRHQQHP